MTEQHREEASDGEGVRDQHRKGDGKSVREQHREGVSVTERV